ncbi:MAG: hypothetical protein KDI92_10730 [Xanthomonadales bacterium]|nr:hypothetical protein [Xanthomonadales bacterium]
MELNIACTLDGRDLAVIKSIININNIFGDLNLNFVDDIEHCHVLIHKTKTLGINTYYAKDCVNQEQHKIKPTLNPKSVREIFELLGNTLKETLPKVKTPTTQIISIQQFILQLCQKQTDKMLLIEHPEFAIIIDNQANIARSSLEMNDELMQRLARQSISGIKFKYIHDTFVLESQHQMPLSVFNWNLGFFKENDLINSSFNERKKVFKLISWPNFGKYKFEPEFINLCSRLKKNTASFQDLVTVTGYSNEIVNKFLNATLMTGMVVSEESGQQMITPQKHDSHFIGSLKKFFGLK